MSVGDEWRECVRWFIRLGIIDEHHQVNWASSKVLDFAQMLRDGVLLCRVANRLHDRSIDQAEISQRPQMSQFLCLTNICQFLSACQKTFQIPNHKLFNAQELYGLKDFGKVLNTLSYLSWCEVVQREHPDIEGFPRLAAGGRPITSRAAQRASPMEHEHEYYNQENYRDLEEEAETRELTAEAYTYDDDVVDDYGKIYDFVVTGSSAQHTADTQRQSQALHRRYSFNAGDITLATPRDHAIKELLETEEKYVFGLNEVLAKFFTPLREVFNPEDHMKIFMNLQDLAHIHTAFHSELGKAVRVAVNQNAPITPTGINSSGDLRIGDVFVRWKTKFIAYSFYCSHLPAAQKHCVALSNASPTVNKKIMECEERHNENRFKLADILTLPFQRVLKYPLLLKGILKHTPEGHPDYQSLLAGYEAVNDLAAYVNEMKRDIETMAVMKTIRSSIYGMNMRADTTLEDYGRLVKDHEIKIMLPSDKRNWKQRWAFAFERAMIICKPSKNNQYTYKMTVQLNEYRLDESPEANVGENSTLKLSALSSKSAISTWQLVNRNNPQNVIFMQAKSLEQKSKWIEAIRLAQDNCVPAALEKTDHQLKYHTFSEPTVCAHCSKLLKGAFWQGYLCERRGCEIALHKSCIAESAPCHPRSTSIHHLTSLRSRTSTTTSTTSGLNSNLNHFIGQKLRTTTTFKGTNSKQLSFDEDALIEIIGVSHDQQDWLQGRLPETGEIGFFPLVCITQRRPSASVPRRWDSWNGRQDAPSSPSAQINRVRSHVGAASIIEEFPRNGCVDVSDIQGYPWYEECDRTEATEKLLGLPTGTFLVRYSTKRGYAISLSHNAEVKHVKIEEVDGAVFLDESSKFHSIPELIEYYKEHNLQESFTALDTTLKQCFAECVISVAVALYKYDATAPNELSLMPGDKVLVLNKTSGNARGWWKGKIHGQIGYFPFRYVQETDGGETDLPRLTPPPLPPRTSVTHEISA